MCLHRCWCALEIALLVHWTFNHDVKLLDEALQGEVADVLIGIGKFAHRASHYLEIIYRIVHCTILPV